MGRQKRPLNEDAPFGELARSLRALRKDARLTYRTMAARIADPGCSAATLSRADSGDFLPRKEVVVAYGAACGVSRERMVHMWNQAAGQARRLNAATGGGARGETVPAGAGFRPRLLELIWEPVHLLLAMHHLRSSAGDPSLGLPPLPKSTVADLLSGIRLPTEEQFMTYVTCCGVPEVETRRWLSAYRRTVGSLRATATWENNSSPLNIAAQIIDPGASFLRFAHQTSS
jgi:hypothetical protein